MEKLVSVLGVLSPLLLLVAAGYFSRKLNYFPKSAADGIAVFITKLAIPVSLFTLISSQDLGQILDLRLILGYALATAGIAIIAFLIALYFLNASSLRAMTIAFGSSTSNAVMIGFALMIASPAFGAAGPKALTILFLVQSCVMVPVKLALWRGLKNGSSINLGQVAGLLVQSVKNPIIASILGGMAVALLRLAIPDPITLSISNHMSQPWLLPLTDGVATAANFISRSAAGLALFFIGSTLFGANIWSADRQVIYTMFLKLIGHPLLMLIAMYSVYVISGPGFDWETARACVALAAIPMVSVYPAVAATFGEEKFASKSSTLTLVFSAFTLTAILLLTLP